MRLSLQWKNRDGQWCKGPGNDHEIAMALIDRIGMLTYLNPWEAIVSMLSKYCLSKGVENSGHPEVADIWIARYQAIRGIK